jgi:hypothetical protein
MKIANAPKRPKKPRLFTLDPEELALWRAKYGVAQDTVPAPPKQTAAPKAHRVTKLAPAPKSLYEQYVELKATSPAQAGAFWRKHKAAIIAANYSSGPTMTREEFGKLTPQDKSRFSKSNGKLVN